MRARSERGQAVPLVVALVVVAVVALLAVGRYAAGVVDAARARTAADAAALAGAAEGQAAATAAAAANGGRLVAFARYGGRVEVVVVVGVARVRAAAALVPP